MKSPIRPERSPITQSWLAASFIYFICILYGSLLPFDFTFHPWDQAWQKFSAMPYLDLDARSRADWIANLLLYLPLGFVATGTAIRSGGSQIVRLMLLALALAICLGAALGIEFAQVYFPPRTVSYNDLLAETLGTFAGMAIYLLFASKLVSLSRLLAHDKSIAILGVYSVGYLIFSLFPYDFLISRDEILWKLSTPLAAFFLAGSGCTHPISCIAKLAAEALAVAPIGLLLSRHWPRIGLVAAIFLGTLLGTVIEIAQLFLASGISQGASVLTRAIGIAIGCRIAPRLSSFSIEAIPPTLRWLSLLAVVPYLALLAALNGWATHNWLSLHDGLQRLDTLHFLPFYYHYYTTETVAVASLLTQVVMYAPIGLAYWLWRPIGSPAVAALLGGLVALAVETGKLFIGSAHPDPTDVLIAGASAAGMFAAIRWWTGHAKYTPADEPKAYVNQQPSATRRFLALLLAAGIALALWRYPLGTFWPALLLTAYAVAMWRFPSIWLFALPALLPLLDFAPWTGWFFLDEFDLLVLTTLAVGLWQAPSRDTPFRFKGAFVLLVGLLAITYLASTLIGLLPLAPIDGNAFSTYFSRYNSLRVAKGFFFALCLLPLLSAATRTKDWHKLFLSGMATGLMLLVAIVLWERHIFSGLLNFADEFRVTAMFSSMHTGGPQVETYAVLALPFVAAWFWATPSKARFAKALLLFSGAGYVVLVTFARGGYLGLVIALVILALGYWLSQAPKSGSRHLLLPLALVVAVALVALPGVLGSYAQSRLSKAGSDLDVRFAHWQDTLQMIDHSWSAKIFGMGLGRFPETYALRNTHGVHPGNYRFDREPGNSFLRLGTGDSLYVGQRVPVRPGTPYTLSLDMRSTNGHSAKIAAYLCEKQLLYSFRCTVSYFVSTPGKQGWEHLEETMNSGNIRVGNWFSRRPVELSFSAATAGAIIDLDNIELTGPDGDIAANGNFEKGSNRWLFTTDNGWPWRVENLWLQILFEQGWFGLAAFLLFSVYMLFRLAKYTRQGEAIANATLAAMLGVMTVGLFGSVFESPRLAFLFYLALFVTEARFTKHSQIRRVPAKKRPISK